MNNNQKLAVLLTLALPLTAGCRARSLHEATDNSLGSPYSASAAHLDPAKAKNMVSDITLGKKLSDDGNISSENQANRFQPGEPIYLEMKVGGAPKGTPVKVEWSDATSHQKMAEDQQTVGSKPKYVDFQAKDAASWPKGDYQAEVWIGDQQVGTQQFTIVDRNG